jgi:hypothetical protein
MQKIQSVKIFNLKKKKLIKMARKSRGRNRSGSRSRKLRSRTRKPPSKAPPIRLLENAPVLAQVQAIEPQQNLPIDVSNATVAEMSVENETSKPVKETAESLYYSLTLREKNPHPVDNTEGASNYSVTFSTEVEPSEDINLMSHGNYESNYGSYDF